MTTAVKVWSATNQALHEGSHVYETEGLSELPEDAWRAATGPVYKFDNTGMINAYPNVCNVSSSREKVVIIFGMTKAWERERRKYAGS